MIIEIVFYKIGKILVTLYSFFAFRINILIEEKIPSGPKIFVANHPSTTDPFLMLILAKCQVSILIKGKIFEIPFFGKILKFSGHIPVLNDKGYLALEKARLLLKNERSVVIFIEGGVSPSETSYHKPKTGAARLALISGCPIVPVGFSLVYPKLKIVETRIKDGAERACWYTKGPYTATIGKKMHFHGNIEDRDYVRLISQKIMKRVEGLAKMSRKRLILKERQIGFSQNPQNFFMVRNQILSVCSQVLLFIGITSR